MGEELFWGMPVILYLFLAGVGAGAVVVSASVLLRGGSGMFGGRHFAIARYGALIGPIPAILGTTFIVFELGRPFRAINLFKLINLSPMSIGSWLLGAFITLSLLYALLFLPWPAIIWDRLQPARKALAWICIPMGIAVAIYTGVMLGAMPARPFWNSPVLALLFLVSAMSTGVAVIILAQALTYRVPANNPAAEKLFHESGYLLTATDLVLIGAEMLSIFLFVMFAHLTISNVKYAVAIILPGGDLAGMFWFWVVLVGLVIPGLLELFLVFPKIFLNRDYKAPRIAEIIIPLAVLTGGFMLRYVVVVAGQATGPVGL